MLLFITKMSNINLDLINYLSLLPITLLFIILLKIFTKKPKPKQIQEEVFNERIKNFTPRPLIDCSFSNLNNRSFEKLQPNESDPNILNLVKVNYYCFLEDQEIKTDAETCIRKYGVGSCGPRGFYGTIDIHLLLEDRIAKFMEMEEAVLYSYGFSTISSAIGAYCKKSDYIFIDEKISASAKQGLLAAKSNEIIFKHNDVYDLEKKLESLHQLEKREENKKKKLFRKFIIIEGIYGATGQICPLPEIISLCKKHKVRIFIDESHSFGVLGKTGKGVTEHFDVDRSEVDMIMGSLEGALGSIGGFCVGASVVIEHQRLSGLGYCFSASLPPFLCQSSLCALDRLEECPDLIAALQKVSVSVNNALSGIKGFKVVSTDISPIKVFILSEETSSAVKIEKTKKIYSYCAQKGLFLDCVGTDLKFYCNIRILGSKLDKIKSILADSFQAL